MAKKTLNDSRMLAALCYPLWPVALILLMFDHKDPFVRYSAYNGLGFAFGILILSVPVAIVSWIPVAGWMIRMVFWVGIVLLAISYALQTYGGKRVFIPVVTDFLKRNIKGFK